MNDSSIPLGKAVQYPDHYQPDLLFPIPRQEKRDELGLATKLPFHGSDFWNAYELSWLNTKGKPQVAIGVFEFDCASPNIIESKSFKLYLNSFNQAQFSSWEEVSQQLKIDLSAASQSHVGVELFSLQEYNQRYSVTEFEGTYLDHLDIEVSGFEYKADIVKLDHADQNTEVIETLYSDLLKSNCLITSQPDWASLSIAYRGKKICHESLLRYVLSFRNHNEFHEQCVERIFSDIMRACQPTELTVYARYTRRGGLDINPWRSTHATPLQNLRLSRQ